MPSVAKMTQDQIENRNREQFPSLYGGPDPIPPKAPKYEDPRPRFKQISTRKPSVQTISQETRKNSKTFMSSIAIFEQHLAGLRDHLEILRLAKSLYNAPPKSLVTDRSFARLARLIQREPTRRLSLSELLQFKRDASVFLRNCKASYRKYLMSLPAESANELGPTFEDAKRKLQAVLDSAELFVAVQRLVLVSMSPTLEHHLPRWFYLGGHNSGRAAHQR